MAHYNADEDYPLDKTHEDDEHVTTPTHYRDTQDNTAPLSHTAHDDGDDMDDEYNYGATEGSYSYRELKNAFNEYRDNTVDENGELLDEATVDSYTTKSPVSRLNYEIVNWINPRTNVPFSRLRLNRKYPVLRFTQELNGGSSTELSIILTRDLAYTLSDSLKQVGRTMDGYALDEKEPLTWKRFKDKVISSFKHNPLRWIGIGVLVSLIGISLILSVIR